MQKVSIEQSGAFIERFALPPTGEGSLRGLRFAVKDLIDVAGHRTGCGNPTWRETHPAAAVSAVCVEQLLEAGARCEGKTVTDELAFSLLGENHFYGTPLNPAAPDRVPGGSSSGSASAVACGLVDFALGTDTGGSVRVPASNCGIWGWRPTHGRISVAGVMPLAPSFDTVGVLARSPDVLQRAGETLLASTIDSSAVTGTVHLVIEALALADAEVREALRPAIECVTVAFQGRLRETSLAELCGNSEAADLSGWLNAYRVIMAAEIGSSLGGWIAASKPALGPVTAAGFAFVDTVDRTRLNGTIGRRERLFEGLRENMRPGDLLCMPTAPTVAPLKGSKNYDRGSDYYRRTLSMTSIAGVARLPQVSMPLGSVDGVPIGLSILGAQGADLHLLEAAKKIGERWHEI
jgi:amidase